MTPPPRTGRPREFDPEVALDQALDVFWSQGFEGTSMSQLVGATGVQKGSLYKAFGDKHELFVQALRRYLDRGLEQLQETLGGPQAPAQSLRLWLEDLGRECSDPAQARGCFALNTLGELAQGDPEIAGLLDAHFERFGAVLEDVVARAQAAGELPDHSPPADLAGYLLVVLAGLRATAKSSLAPDRAKRLVDIALGALER